jgi:ABC-2 type transport system ATP-binding protein
VSQLPQSDHITTTQRDDGSIVFSYRAQDITADDVLQFVKSSGITIADVRTEQADLEDVFLSLTKSA